MMLYWIWATSRSVSRFASFKFSSGWVAATCFLSVVPAMGLDTYPKFIGLVCGSGVWSPYRLPRPTGNGFENWNWICGLVRPWWLLRNLLSLWYLGLWPLWRSLIMEWYLEIFWSLMDRMEPGGLIFLSEILVSLLWIKDLFLTCYYYIGKGDLCDSFGVTLFELPVTSFRFIFYNCRPNWLDFVASLIS